MAEEAERDAIVVTTGLTKRFRRVEALRGLDLAIAPGTVFGLLGPNGAGKTTLVRILATLVRPDAGRAWVAGHDVAARPDQVRRCIGLAGQYAAVDEKLSGRDNLRILGRLHHLSEREARRRADDLLQRFGLQDEAHRLAGTYSGGLRRRLDLVASLLVAPRVLFLDEPTAGLDPVSRNHVWASVATLASSGTTVLLTTQYLEEADRLADRIAVVDHGTVIASGTPEALKSTIGSRLDVVVPDAATVPRAASVLARFAGADVDADPEQRRVSVAVDGGSLVLTDVVRELDRSGVLVEDVALRRPTLDEVFLRLTDAPAPLPADAPAA